MYPSAVNMATKATLEVKGLYSVHNDLIHFHERYILCCDVVTH
jgi:hypothetical protein